MVRLRRKDEKPQDAVEQEADQGIEKPEASGVLNRKKQRESKTLFASGFFNRKTR